MMKNTMMIIFTIFPGVLSGENSNFNIFIERKNGYWFPVSEELASNIINNDTGKYNNMVSARNAQIQTPSMPKILH